MKRSTEQIIEVGSFLQGKINEALRELSKDYFYREDNVYIQVPKEYFDIFSIYILHKFQSINYIEKTYSTVHLKSGAVLTAHYKSDEMCAYIAKSFEDSVPIICKLDPILK